MLNPFTNRKLARGGEPARAWVRRMPSPPRGGGARAVAMTLDVQRADGARYEVQDRWMVAGDEPIAVGSEIRVLVDPERRGRLVIDWDRTRQLHNEKQEERRRLLPVGVPVPVAKIHQEAEERGLIDPAPADRKPAAFTVAAVPAPVAAPNGAEPALEPPAAPRREVADDLIDRLERLAALHAAGALTDDEFAAVKRHLIG